MPSLAKANEARAAAVLAGLIRTSDYGVVSYREFATNCLRDGGRVATAEIPDDAARAKLEKDFAFMNRGFNIPWGNDRHPKTIQAQAMKDRLSGPILKTEYRLYAPLDAYWYVIPKFDYDFAISLLTKTAQ